MQGIIEMVDYLKYNQDILLSESENDLFHLYFELVIQAEMNHYDVTPLKERMDKIAEVIRKLNIYDDKLVSYRLNEYKNHDFTQYAMDEFATPGEDDNVSDDALYEKINMNIDFEATIGDRLYKGGLFSSSAKQSDFVDLMYDLIDAFIVQLKSEVIEQINLQKRAVKEISEDYLRYKQWKTESERNIANNTERMALIDKEIEIIKEKIESIEERREADKEIIDDYLRIADTEFVKYKNSLLEMLDSDTFSTEEKVILLIYLCIIEKDFQSITEMG